MGGVFKGGGGSKTTTKTITTSKTILENDTEVNVVFDFEEMAKVYQARLDFDMEQALKDNDGEFTEEQKIKIRAIAVEEENMKLQKEALSEQRRNNRLVLIFSLVGLWMTWLGLKKTKRI